MSKEIETAYKRLSENKIYTRSAEINSRIKSLNESDRSVEAVFVNERKVRVFDWEQWDIIDEIILMSGLEFPERIPMLDSHQRYSVSNQLGSGSDMEVKGKKLIGRLNFSKKQTAEDAFNDVKEGHLTDVSIGYRHLETVWIDKGNVHRTEDGREFKGPMRLSIRTEIMEISLTPIGADSMAKVRSATEMEATPEKLKAMHEENERLKKDIESARRCIQILTA